MRRVAWTATQWGAFLGLPDGEPYRRATQPLVDSRPELAEPIPGSIERILVDVHHLGMDVSTVEYLSLGVVQQGLETIERVFAPEDVDRLEAFIETALANSGMIPLSALLWESPAWIEAEKALDPGHLVTLKDAIDAYIKDAGWKMPFEPLLCSGWAGVLNDLVASNLAALFVIRLTRLAHPSMSDRASAALDDLIDVFTRGNFVLGIQNVADNRKMPLMVVVA